MLKTSIHSAVYWVNDIVCGVSLIKQRYGFKIIKSAQSKIVNGDLLSSLDSVCSDIEFNKSEFNIFCGDMGNSIVFDLVIPAISEKDIDSLLDFENVQRLPVSLDSIKRQWRIIKTFDDEGNKKQIVRVVVIDLKHWNEKLDIISQLNYRSDIITSVKLVADPICEGKDIAIYGLMDNFIWQYNKDSFKRDISVTDPVTFEFKEKEFRKSITNNVENCPSCSNDQERNAFCCALIASMYSFSSSVEKDKNILNTLPKNLRAKRLVKQKLYSALLFLLIFAVSLVLYLHKDEEIKIVKTKTKESKEVVALRKEVIALQSKNTTMKRLSTRLGSFGKTNTRNLQLTEVLLYLGRKLPKYCWLNDLRQNGGYLDFSVTAYSNTENILNDLGKVSKIDKKSIRKRSKGDDSVYVSMRAVWFDSKKDGAAGASKGGDPASRGFGGMDEDEKSEARKNKVDYSSWSSMEDIRNVFRDPVSRHNMFLNMKEDPEYAKGLIEKVRSIDPKAERGITRLYEHIKSGKFNGGFGGRRR